MSVSNDITDSGCSNAIGQYITLAKVQAQAVLSSVGIQLNTVIASAAEADFGSLWDEVSGGPLQAANDAISSAFGFDPNLASAGKATLGDAASGLTSGDTYTTAVAPITDSFKATMAAYTAARDGNTDHKQDSVHKEENPYYRKSSTGNACASNQLAATASAVVSQVSGTISSVYDQVMEAQAGLAAGMSNIPGFTDALFSKGVQALNSYYNVESDILKELIDTAKDIQDELRDLEINDLTKEHDAIIRAARMHLCHARVAFSRVGNAFLKDQGFDEVTYNAGQDRLKQAEDVVGGTKFQLPEFQLPAFKLLAKVQLFQTLRMVWLREQRVREDIKLNLILFDEDITTDFRNLYAPVIDYIRCRIEYLVQDMTNSLGNGSPMEAYAKEKSWWLGIFTLRQTSRVIEEILGVLDKPISLALDLSLDLKTTYQNQENLLEQAKGFDRAMQDFLNSTYAVLMQTSKNKSVAIARGNWVVGLATDRKTKLDNQKGFGEEYLSEDVVGVLEDVAQVSQYLEVLSGSSISNLADAVKKGDIKSILNLDVLGATLESQLKLTFDKLGKCLQENTDDQAAAIDSESILKGLSNQIQVDAQEAALKKAEEAEAHKAVLAAQKRLESVGHLASITSSVSIPSVDADVDQLFADMNLSGLGTEILAATDLDDVENIANDLLTPSDLVDASLYGTSTNSDTTIDNITPVSLGLPEIVTLNDILNTEDKPLWWPAQVSFPLSLDEPDWELTLDLTTLAITAHYVEVGVQTLGDILGSTLTPEQRQAVTSVVNAIVSLP
jgi:hypothetical protein